MPQFPHTPLPGGIDLVLHAKKISKGHISFFYNLLSPSSDLAVNKVKAKWESELQISISDEFWKRALKAINSSFSCARLSLIQFKVYFRLHYSKDKLSKLYPDKVTEACNRCSQSPCNLTHMFWSCPKLFSYWQSFFKSMSDIFRTERLSIATCSFIWCTF